MEFINPDIMAYAQSHSQQEPELLQELYKETHQKILQPRMISGHFQGRLLSLLSTLARPSKILEIGTYTGYTTLCLAEGLPEEGEIHTIEINEELLDFQKKYFGRSTHNHQIISHWGDAKTIIPKLNFKFDLVFIDADKSNYVNYLEMILPKLNSGGLLIADNVLWNGKVLQEEDLEKDLETKALKQFNEKIKGEKTIYPLLIPLRDGLMICRKH